jgi:uncharacterized protein
MTKTIVHIRGMHCKSCEILVEKNLKKISGVASVSVRQNTGIAEIHYPHDKKPSRSAIIEAIKNAGYEIGIPEKDPWLSSDPVHYKNLAAAAAILLGLYYFARGTGIFNLNISPDNSGIFVALLVGLVAGVSTCMALVGGLVLGLASRHAEIHPEATPTQKFRPHIYFNLGRIGGYAVLGGIIGWAGSALKPSPSVLGALTLLVGVAMVLLGLKLVEIFPKISSKTLSLPSSIARIVGLNFDAAEYSHKGAVIMGALTFFLPCGFTQAMQLYAVSTGSFMNGAAVMFLFALGTAPGLLGVGGLTSSLKGPKARLFFSTAGLAVILLGGYNIVNGGQLVTLARGSGIGSIAPQAGAAQTEAQTVFMTQDSSGYNPNILTVQKGKLVKWIIDSISPFTCAASIVMPSYDISRQLQKGQNIIEFMPTQAGEIPFSCSMGMFRGKFIVTDDSPSATLPKAPIVVANAGSLPLLADIPSRPSQGGSCGSSGGGCGCGGGAAANTNLTAGSITEAVLENGEQVIRSSFSVASDISPNTFRVRKGVPVRYEISPTENGAGCMGAIKVPGLYEQAQPLRAGQTVVMAFTPVRAGDYYITCAMGVKRGVIKVTD